MYDTVEEARQKLENSTVLFDGHPVLVLAAHGNKNKVILDYHTIPVPPGGARKATESVLINDPRWDFRGLGTKLGYVNVQSPFDGVKEAVFTYRIPTRTSRQGLDGRTGRIQQFPQQLHGWNWENLLYVDGLDKTINGVFPSTQEAREILIKDYNSIRSVAIGRKLALIYDRVNPPNLIYRNEKVGYTEDGTTFKLADHKQFLKEELQDMFYLKIA